MDPMTLAALAFGGSALASQFEGSSWKHPFGNKKKASSLNQLPTMNAGQSKLLDQLLSQLGNAPPTLGQNKLYQQGSDVLSKMLSGEADTALEGPLMKQFQEEIIPMIQERFSGSSGSSGLNQSLSRAAHDLLQSFGSLRSQNRQSALSQILGYSQAPGNEYYNRASLALGERPFQYQEKPVGFLGSLLAGGAGTFSQELGKGLYKSVTGPQAA